MYKYLFLIIAILLSVSCTEEDADRLVGKWERFDDDAAGSIVKVQRVGDTYQGTLIEIKGKLKGLGFKRGDIKWKEITFKQINSYEGSDLLKGVDKWNKVVFTNYDNVFFEVIANDILRITGAEPNAQGKSAPEQKWRRLQ